MTIACPANVITLELRFDLKLCKTQNVTIEEAIPIPPEALTFENDVVTKIISRIAMITKKT